MRGRTAFTTDEAAAIRELLGEIRSAPRDQQKGLRAKLRKVGFYIEDFDKSRSGFSIEDFDRLVASGQVQVSANGDAVDEDDASVTGVWWANQGKSYEQGSAGGYLWAPLQDRGGARRSYHKALEQLSLGDVVLGYADRSIKALIEIDAETEVAPNPSEGDEREGYLSRAVYWELANPIGIEELPPEIRRPESGPFMKNGDPILGYLFPLSETAAQRIRDDFRDRWPLNSPWANEQALNTSALHLLFKWNAEREPRTVDIHRDVAKNKGSVWWGKFGRRERAALSAKNINTIRSQLEDGLPTYAFIYRAGETWQTELLDITVDENDVDLDRLPNYYRPDECELFVRVTDFRKLEDHWPETNLVLASNPDPERMPGALSNQATPLIVRMNPQTTNRPSPAPKPSDYDLDWLQQETFWPESALLELIESVTEGGQIVLAGPPGTGKTHVAKRLATYLTEDELTVKTVQFHPSYGYEEFIEGLRPSANGDGSIEFSVKPGVVRLLASDAENAPHYRVLVIDEMNRANLPRVFGELMYLFEYRDDPIDLQYTSDFSLPGNLLFIGTMNTADRSIRAIDVALRRRFDVFECPPSVEILKRFYQRPGYDNQVDNLFDGFQVLNAELEAALDRHHTIGHTFFMNRTMDKKRLDRTWRLKIGPLIEEYFFDQPDYAAEYSVERFWPA